MPHYICALVGVKKLYYIFFYVMIDHLTKKVNLQNLF